jgi:glycerate kinase
MPLREAAFERPACEHGGMRRIVIAPDAFKGSITARDAALALAEGWWSIRADDALLLVPQADGGEGTLEAVAAGRPDAQWRTATVAGPLGDPHTARWLLLPGAQAVVELAESCGITLLPQASDGSPAFAPLAASTRGLGETIAAALDAGARGLTIALGGSASTDGGLGARRRRRGGRPARRDRRGRTAGCSPAGRDPARRHDRATHRPGRRRRRLRTAEGCRPRRHRAARRRARPRRRARRRQRG